MEAKLIAWIDRSSEHAIILSTNYNTKLTMSIPLLLTYKAMDRHFLLSQWL